MKDLMTQEGAIRAIAQRAESKNALIVADIGSQSGWLKATGDSPRHLYLSGPMGMASSVALGIACARPGRNIFAICGDGALAMNLSSLISIGQKNPRNLTIFVIVNGAYDFTQGLMSPSRNCDWSALCAAAWPAATVCSLLDWLDSANASGGQCVIADVISEPKRLPPPLGLKAHVVADRFRAEASQFGS